MYPFELVFLCSLGKYLVVQLLTSRVVLFLTVWGTSILFFRVTSPVCLPTNNAGVCRAPFSTSSPKPVVSSVDFSHFDGCEVISHCSFDLYFPDDEWCWASFHVSVGHLYVFFGKVCIHIFCPYIKWIIHLYGYWLLQVLYIFWILTLYHMCHLQISSPTP